MNAIWRTIRGYILWQYERGTLHYDIMVTLILIFIFVSPHVINFNAKPIPRNPHPSDVVVTAAAQGQRLYPIEARAVTAAANASLRQHLLRILQHISSLVFML